MTEDARDDVSEDEPGGDAAPEDAAAEAVDVPTTEDPPGDATGAEDDNAAELERLRAQVATLEQKVDRREAHRATGRKVYVSGEMAVLYPGEQRLAGALVADKVRFYRGNARLRRLGLRPHPIGASPTRDRVKHAVLATAFGAQSAVKRALGKGVRDTSVRYAPT